MLIDEEALDEWVRANSHQAQRVIVDLVLRLVSASSPNPRDRRFPLAVQPGPDGVLDTGLPYGPFVPADRSYWEIGTSLDARDKATDDYKDRTAATPQDVRAETAFVFVTPLSGRRNFPNTWKDDNQAAWVSKRSRLGEWREVRVLDATRLVDWMRSFPAVALWLAQTMGRAKGNVETAEQHWELIRSIGSPPPLSPEVFLEGRDEARARVADVVSGNLARLQLDTRFRAQAAPFVSAVVSAMDDERRVEAVGRCLIVPDSDSWHTMVNLPQRHVLVAAFDVDNMDPNGLLILERATQKGHAVILGGQLGGVPTPSRVALPQPDVHRLKGALEKSGYREERARVLAQQCNGNLSILLRIIQNLSETPDWAQQSSAADLAIAGLLAAWSERSTADIKAVEGVSGKAYGEWIGQVRSVTTQPDTPLSHRDGLWKLSARYEAWYALGSHIRDVDLDRFREQASVVLGERDPRFELANDERYAAAIHGKVLAHSQQLRRGIAETLALLGAHPQALTACSQGKAEATVVLVLRSLLLNQDWIAWAGLNDVLPLLAEGSPRAFLDAVEEALMLDPCPFDRMFAEEGPAVTGTTYMSGLMWALETLAWEADSFARVILVLGELAKRDPGGTWSNRPANTLVTIFLPWLPQTCAPFARRKRAIESLLAENGDVAWNLLLKLLPSGPQSSMYTSRPTWREVIPTDWSSGVTGAEYQEQVAAYSELALGAARLDARRLIELISRINDLHPSAQSHLLTHLSSPSVAGLGPDILTPVWEALSELVRKHHKFADADWAMSPEELARLSQVAEKLAPQTPALRERHLFAQQDFDLYDEKGDYQGQAQRLKARREAAVASIYNGSLDAILAFAKTVEAPWLVGVALGAIAPRSLDNEVIPTLLGSQEKPVADLAGGFAIGRLQAQGWTWVDEVLGGEWPADQVGLFLSLLPFEPEAWERSRRVLGADESSYWTRTPANPYQTDQSLDAAIPNLLNYGRPRQAIRCFARLLHDKRPIDSSLCVRALLDAAAVNAPLSGMDAHDIGDLIEVLQSDPNVLPEQMKQIELIYLGLLDEHSGHSPKHLERALASDPDLFCEAIRTVFRSKKAPPDEKADGENKAMAGQVYRLLHQWSVPPGSNLSGTFDGPQLDDWLARVKTQCTESGHLEVAMIMVGHVLTHSPPDPDGLWIHRAVAGVLNAKDATDLRSGFRTELFNSWGVHWVDPSGAQERERAQHYKKQGDDVEGAGYPRLASTLRDLAADYEREAQRTARENERE